MSKYTVKSYQEGFAEDQAQLDLEVSKTWIMPDHTPLDQLIQFYSDLDIDPELRLYCFLEDTMIGFVSCRFIDERDDGINRTKLDFPVVLPEHEEAIDLLHEKTIEVLRGKGIQSVHSTFGLWGRTDAWAEKWGYRRIDEIGVLYGIDVSSVSFKGETEEINPFNPETDLDDCVRIFVQEYGLPEEDVRNFTISLIDSEQTLAYYVLREDGNIVATGALVRNPNAPTLGSLNAVYSKGTNDLKRLLIKITNTSKEHGIEKLLMFFTHLRPDDPEIIKYTALGFSYLGSNVNYEKAI
jgi:hypothetical protein